MNVPQRLVVFMIALVMLVPVVLAQAVPTVMNYQGRLTDNSPGQTPIDSSLPITFRIFDAQMGGVLEWEEAWGGVPVTGGIFSVLLGSNGVPIPSTVFSGGSTRYLEVVVNGETLAPRQRLGAVGFAQQAEVSADVDCPGCVQSGEIATDAVGSAEVQSNAISATHLAPDSVGASEIAFDAVGSSELAANAVGNSEINNFQSFTFNASTIFEVGGAEWISRNAGVDKLEMWADPNASYFYHRPAGSYFAVNDSTGNWGVDTTSPADKLTVSNGSVRADSFIDGDNTTYYANPAGASVFNSVSVSSQSISDAFPLLIIDGINDNSGYGGFLFREAGSNRWLMRNDNAVASQFQLFSYGAGSVLTSNYTTGDTNIRNLQLTVTSVVDNVTAVSNSSPACPAGTRRTGGGCRCATGSLEKSYPSGSATWYCECSVSTDIQAHAVCIESTDP